MPHSNVPSPAARAACLPRALAALRLLALLLVALAALPAQAHHGERWAGLRHTAFRHHAQSDLGSGTCLVQDRAGFLWIGTQSGLVRWDGNRAVKYVADATRDDALPDSYIISLHVDSQGRLWAGMSAGGLVRYDPARDRFVRYRAGAGGLRDPRVAAMADDGSGGLWIATGSGLDHLGADGRFQQPGATDGNALPDGGIDRLLRDADGTLWAGTRRGLFQLRADQPARQVALGGRSGLAISTLYRDSAGRLWIGSRTSGAFVIAAGSSTAMPVRESGPQATLAQERVAAIVEAAPDEIWLGTEGADGGIVALDLQHGSSRRIRHRDDSPDSLADNDVMALFRERSGIIFATNMNGLSQHDPQPQAVTTVRHLHAEHGGMLSAPNVLAAADGRLWLSTASDGVVLIDPLRGQHAPPTTVAGLPRGRVLALATGPDGEIYLGTQHGLFRASADGRRVQRVPLAQRRQEEEVWVLAQAGRTLWVGGLDGVWELDLRPGAAPRVRRHEDQRLGDPRVTAILPDGDGAWVGTRTGLARLGADTVEPVAADLARADRLSPGYVSSLLLDARGRLWLSNFGIGVLLLEGRDADGQYRFRRLGMRQGLPDSNANKLLQDRDGNIWASTDAGLARIEPRTLAIRRYGPGEGVHIPTYWTNSGAVTDAGELVFGGLSGLSVVRPQTLDEWHQLPPLVVTRIQLNDQDIAVGPYNAGLGRKAPPITVSTAARERGFAVEFAALDYSAPERNRYAYQLQGFDRNWVASEASTRHASYNNLPPGDYVLQLRGSNRNGEWATPLDVPVRVLPAWHQQWLARLVLGLLALALGAGLLHARTAYLRRRQHELEAMVEARTAELRATQAQLETLAYSDALTGLANRRLFNDDLRLLVAQAERGGADFALLLIDLDRFKQVNDTLGHDAGDTLLVATAARLRAALRESDRPYRLGGDEFAVLLERAGDRATLAPVCERILEGVTAPLPHGADVIRISASIGAAIHAPAEDHEQLYKRADLALYEAKAAGRHTWQLAASAANASAS